MLFFRAFTDGSSSDLSVRVRECDDFPGSLVIAPLDGVAPAFLQAVVWLHYLYEREIVREWILVASPPEVALVCE